MFDILNEIIATIKKNKLRTALTGFAVAWGIFMLIFLLGAGNGLINAQMKAMNNYLANSMMVGSGFTTKAANGFQAGRLVTLDDGDVALTKRGFKHNIDAVGATAQLGSTNVSTGQDYVTANLQGVYPNFAGIEKVKIVSGRFINEPDMQQKRRVVVLREDDAEALLPGHGKDMTGRYVKISDMAFLVAGIYKTDQTSYSSSAYIPFSTFRTIYNKGTSVENINFSFHGLQTMDQNKDFEQAYKARLNRRHHALPDDEGGVWINNRFTQNMQMDTGISLIRSALWVIGLFTLLSGIVGVSNIMLITVKERTREFGIRKAIGARPLSILRLIIVESVLITTFFGYIGMLLGIAANQYMDATIGHETVSMGGFTATVFLNPTVGFGTCVAATMVMVLAGTVAGLIPAMKAARIRPIEALRAE